jgi:GNAT superfamily N-acetyltransferase
MSRATLLWTNNACHAKLPRVSLSESPILIRPAAPSEIWPLRHQILRSHQPFDQAKYPSDTLPTSFHAGVFDAHGTCLACATLHHEPWENQPAFRLRGMAVAPAHRRRGLGARVLQLLESHALAQNIPLLWCQARTPAIPFYQSQGWQITSNEFEVPGIGPHFTMLKHLKSGE